MWTLLLTTLLNTREGRPLRVVLFVDSPTHYSCRVTLQGSSVCCLSSLLFSILLCDDPSREFCLWTLLLTTLLTPVLGRPLRGVLFVLSSLLFSIHVWDYPSGVLFVDSYSLLFSLLSCDDTSGEFGSGLSYSIVVSTTTQGSSVYGFSYSTLLNTRV